MGFRYDTKDLTPQQRAIIDQRDRNDKLLRKSSNNFKKEEFKECDLSIFMRLGNQKNGQNGIETMEIYSKYCKQNGVTWFSTDSLSSGIAKEKQKYFLNAIKNGYKVYIYFVIGKNAGGKNEIEYRAEVLDIISDPKGVGTPEAKYTPDSWLNDINKIWIKIRSLEKYNHLSTSDFVVKSTGNILSKAIENSQYHFGYIKKK